MFVHITIAIIRSTCAQSSTFALLMSRTIAEKYVVKHKK